MQQVTVVFFTQSKIKKKAELRSFSPLLSDVKVFFHKTQGHYAIMYSKHRVGLLSSC